MNENQTPLSVRDFLTANWHEMSENDMANHGFEYDAMYADIKGFYLVAEHNPGGLDITVFTRRGGEKVGFRDIPSF